MQNLKSQQYIDHFIQDVKKRPRKMNLDGDTESDNEMSGRDDFSSESDFPNGSSSEEYEEEGKTLLK